ncbi:MAG TPA: MFS transporter [Gaiellaceae bacterium]|nr:MFS transporter [Gaiellaceae bacterium]
MRLSSDQLTPLRLPGFRNLFLATLGSSVGTLLAAVALALDVKDRTDSSPHSGLWVFAVLVVEFLPTIAVGLLLGPLLDRLERRSLMIAADVLRVGVFVALPFAPNAASVVGLAFVAGLATGFFRPAVYAGVPNLVPDEELPRANALLQTVENASWAVGPLLGGVLTAAAGPSASYAINAASFVVSIALLVRIPPRLLQSERALSRGHWTDLRDGFRAALQSPSMRAVLVGWGVASLATGVANVSEIFLAKDTFSAGDFGYGLLYAAIGGGLVLGSFASAGLLARYGVAGVYGGSLAVMAAGYGAAAASPNVWVAAACCVVFGLGNGGAVACNALLVQRGTFDLLRGRALTFVMSVTYALLGVGEGLGGLFLNQAGARWLWGGSAGLLLVAALCGSLLARKLGGETAAAAEVAPTERTPVTA